MKKKVIKTLLIVLGVVLAGVLGTAGYLYYSGYSFYQNHFYEGTKVSMMAPDGSTVCAEGDLSGMTLEDAQNYVGGLTAGYVLSISEPDGSTEPITAADIALGLSDEGKETLEAAFAAQDYKTWFLHITDLESSILTQRVTVDSTITVASAYDETALDAKIDALKCITPDTAVAPENAFLTYDESTYRYVVKEGKIGNVGLKDQITEKIDTALATLSDSITLDSSDYEQPEVTVEDEFLCTKRDEINKYLSASITLKEGDLSYVVDGKDIINFLDIDDDWNVTLNEKQINRFISAELDTLFDTVGISRTIETPSSGTITVSGGTFGRMVKTADELPKLVEEITAGETVERQPCYYDTAYEQTTENAGIGNSYVDVNITTQTVSVVKDGVVTIQSDCVTGLTNGVRDTPTGIYYITRKTTDYTMVKYSSFVHYWMPIDDSTGVGLHDATWRSKFGGEIYKKSGSHGCINLPLAKAKEIYAAVNAKDIVIVHY